MVHFTPVDQFVRIPNHVLNTVAFVCVSDPDDGSPQYVGTAFLVGVPSEVHAGMRYNYIVTAAHVADAVQGFPFFLRVNTCDQRFREFAPRTPSGEQFPWFRHKDPFVDVAVHPLFQKPPDIEWEAIWFEDFLTPRRIRDKDIGLGDEVYCVGLFSLFTGEQRNSPIVRVGSVASMPNERIPISLDDGREGLTEAYLVEMRSMEKLSGSPVFVSHTNYVFLRDIEMKDVVRQYSSRSDEIVRGPSGFHLMGLMHGHWKLPLEEKMAGIYGVNLSQLNVGIAVVTPAKKIRDVLFDPRLVEMRQAGDKEIRSKRTPSPDAAVPKQQRKNRDTPIPEPDRAQVLSDLEKATRRRKP